MRRPRLIARSGLGTLKERGKWREALGGKTNGERAKGETAEQARPKHGSE